MINKKVIVTGGGGFIGAYLVKRLVKDGWKVEVIDTMVRGDATRLKPVIDDIKIHNIDIRSEEKVLQAIKGSDLVIHLAAINGTENFYSKPDLVLDVGIRGALAVVNACFKSGITDLIIASSAEVYQTPSVIPTPEDVALTLPNSLNPRYSYGGSKIISELIALNYHKQHFQKLQIFRPHNIYGPDMGWKHVIPQFICQAINSIKSSNMGKVKFNIQGDGNETRSFCYVDDVVDGIIRMYEYGSHREIYHIGNNQEISIRDLVEKISLLTGYELVIQTSSKAEGGTKRRCPNIKKINSIGYQPKIDIDTGLKRTFEWYKNNINSMPSNKLM